jgi:Lon protease-like protein
MYYQMPKKLDQLPATLPVFPLTGAILLPGCQLPLNIFEPRYLNMVFDALAENRMIGMIQPLPEEERAKSETGLYPVGCAGRITAFEESGEGRVLIRLTGVCRFRAAAELPQKNGYRRILCDWSGYEGDLKREGPSASLTSEQVLGELQATLTHHSIRADWSQLEPLPGDILVNVLAMNMPFDAHAKQMLMEVGTVEERFEYLKQMTLDAVSHYVPANATRH